VTRLAALILIGSVAGAGSAAAQACLSYSDGLGNTTLSCPDGRTGYIRTDPTGVATGMVGTQPYTGTATSLAPPFGPPTDRPGAAYVFLPPSLSPPPSAPPSEPPPLASLAPQPELTALQQAYLQEQAAKSFQKRKAAAAAAAKAASKP
jgi:hypothetical protein